VLFGFLAACTQRICFAAGVLILAQRQAVLVAEQAACLDVFSGGRFRLGVGVGWNEIEFRGLNENFSNRGKRSEEQVRVMQALWAEPHVNFSGAFHRIEDAGINPRPASGRVPIWFGGLSARIAAAFARAVVAASTAPNMVSISLPIAVRVECLAASHAQNPQRDALGFQSGDKGE
jgi:alkanesulfonate monooxygenase SsuD/methylene tetrahydromethanopterin reductase-like flavin-dependent oxidoreductase (luciferase family)